MLNVRNTPSHIACPECKKRGVVFKSHARSFFERMVNQSGLVAFYRCHNCGWRGKRIKLQYKLNFKVVVVYVLMLYVIYYVTSQIIQSYL